MHTSQESENDGLSTHRIEALHDGVFAIVMTLLVLELRVPDATDAQGLLHDLARLWPIAMSYVLSFINLGINWVGMNYQFHYIKRSDRILLWLHIAFLMLIALLPFSTALLGRYSTLQPAYLFYGLNLIAVGMISYVHWCYATMHHRLTSHTISLSLVRSIKRRILVAPVVSLAAIVVSYFSMPASLLLYLFLPPYYLWPARFDQFWSRPAVAHQHD